MELNLQMQGRKIREDSDLPPAGWRGLILICPPLLEKPGWYTATLRVTSANTRLWDVEERGTNFWKAHWAAAYAWVNFPSVESVWSERQETGTTMRFKKREIETVQDLPPVGWRGLVKVFHADTPTLCMAQLCQIADVPIHWVVEASTSYGLKWDRAACWYELVPDDFGLEDLDDVADRLAASAAGREAMVRAIARLDQAEGQAFFELALAYRHTRLMVMEAVVRDVNDRLRDFAARQGPALPGAPPGGGEAPAHMQRSALTEEAFREWFPSWDLPRGTTSTNFLYLLDSAQVPTHTIGFYDENGRPSDKKGKLQIQNQWRPFAAVEQYALLLLHLARNNGQLPTWMKGDDNAVDQD